MYDQICLYEFPVGLITFNQPLCDLIFSLIQGLYEQLRIKLGKKAMAKG